MAGHRLHVLKPDRSALTPADLLRSAHNGEIELHAAAGAAEAMTVGTALYSGEFPRVAFANYLTDVRLPPGARLLPGISAADAFAQVEAFFAERATACFHWQPAGTPGDPSFDALGAHLAGLHWRPRTHRYFVLPTLIALPGRSDLTLIPARASFEKLRELLDAVVAADTDTDSDADAETRRQWVDALLTQLDDTRLDGFLALAGTDPVGHVRLSTHGELGHISGLLVHPGHRRQRVAATLLMALCDLAARARLRHLTLCVRAEDAPAIALYERLGFAPLGERLIWCRP